MDDCSACDNCHKDLTIAHATCVTNATEHLHADSAECVEALEKQLGTYV